MKHFAPDGCYKHAAPDGAENGIPGSTAPSGVMFVDLADQKTQCLSRHAAPDGADFA